MLPIRLEMRNFLAYRTPDPIPLEDLHLACLSGNNGAGKSSLLDAITWALWGKARARSDEDLIHMGQDEMSVTLDFLQDGSLFKVVRSRKSSRRKDGGGRTGGASSLTLYGWDTDKNVFQPISGGVNETQLQINNLLRLTHELFVNSAFLQQGKADTFTTRTPADRKKILSDILGLDRWTDYEDKTKDRLREIEQEIAVLNSRIGDIENQIAQEPIYQNQRDQAEMLVGEATQAVELAEKQLDEVRGADVELRSARESLYAVENDIRERKREADMAQQDVLRYQQQLATFQEILAKEAIIRAGYAQLEEARAADLELGNKLRDLNDLNQHIAALERQLDDARQEIELEVRELETLLIKDQEQVLTGEQVRSDLYGLNAEISQLEDLEQQRDGYNEMLNRLAEESAGLKATNQTLRTEMTDIKDRLDLLSAATEALCPLCGQPLDEQQRAKLLEEMTEQGTERGKVYRANEARMDAIKGETRELQAAIQSATRMLKELPALRTKQGAYQQQITEANAAELRVQAHQVKIESLSTVLNEAHYGETIRVQLEAACAERDSLGYDSSEHDSVRQQMENYLGYQDQTRQLEVAQQSVTHVTELLDNAHQRHERWLKGALEKEQQAITHQETITHLEVKVIEMQNRTHELKERRTELRRAEENLNNALQELRSITTLRERRLSMIEQKSQRTVEENLYEQLKIAFGRNGIPAMIIEAVIPELEDAANHLLGRMTSNRMHIRFDTQREKKTGGIIETLDILISDELGTRDYSLFSGGEAFRINFAIRVALSQLLARRAGAQLRTLFIDEGFGTQDELGRERLVEAITAIQDDFDLILVITHIDELKDAFPARIEVTKTATGSVAVVR